MKKVLLINGSPHEAGCTFTALSEIEASLKKHGIESDLLYLGKKPLSGCTDCGFCAKAGKCVFEDAVNETIARLDQYDAIVAGTPVYYGGPSGQLCCFMDRLCFAGGSRLADGVGQAVGLLIGGQGVQGQIDFAAPGMGVNHAVGQLLGGKVGGCRPHPEFGQGAVHGVCSIADRIAQPLQVPRRGQQLRNLKHKTVPL